MSGRKRFVAVGNKWVEVSNDYVQPAQNHDAVLWNDRAYTELNDPRFSSRSTHREYMKSRGLTTVDDYKGQFERDAKARADFFTKGTDPTRVHDVVQALQQHTQRRK